MKEARNVIISVLLLLFILVGVGVAISRIADKEKTDKVVKTDNQRGFIERIFLGTGTPTPSPTPKKGLVIVSEKGITPTPTLVMAKVTPTAPAGASASTIPSTGPETAVLVYSLVGLSTGILLKKRS